jgi:hypothetical protein
MKTRLLIILCFGILNINAQTTYDLDWYRFIGSNVDLTIDIGDTVRWTWGDEFPHTVQNVVGSSVETFNSGTKTGEGLTYSRTFTIEGLNDYYCGVHGAVSMSGTITVQNSLGVDEKTLTNFKMFPNPTNSTLRLDFPSHINKGIIGVFDLLGKELYTIKFEASNSVELDVSHWSQGVYLIKVRSANLTQAKQFIKN